MELYIRIVDGKPFEHPILGDNFRQAFPNVDVTNLPPEFAKFERIECDVQPSVYQIKVCNYIQNENNGWKDCWSIQEMTAEEIIKKQNAIKENWISHPFQSWIFNETICRFEAPIPEPNDGKQYSWNEEQLVWVEL